MKPNKLTPNESRKLATARLLGKNQLRARCECRYRIRHREHTDGVHHIMGMKEAQ